MNDGVKTIIISRVQWQCTALCVSTEVQKLLRDDHDEQQKQEKKTRHRKQEERREAKSVHQQDQESSPPWSVAAGV